MKLRSILRRLIPMRWQRPAKDEPLSIILLLRKPHYFDTEELRLAAERAWRISFAGGEGSKHCIVQSGKVTLLKAGPHLLSFFHLPKPYLEDPGEIGRRLRGNRRRAWVEHSACVGVDYLNYDVDVELGYCVLSKLVAEMLDGNCSGIYIPWESALIPNDAALYLDLQKVASSRDSGVSGNPTPS